MNVLRLTLVFLSVCLSPLFPSSSPVRRPQPHELTPHTAIVAVFVFLSLPGELDAFGLAHSSVKGISPINMTYLKLNVPVHMDQPVDVALRLVVPVLV